MQEENTRRSRGETGESRRSRQVGQVGTVSRGRSRGRAVSRRRKKRGPSVLALGLLLAILCVGGVGAAALLSRSQGQGEEDPGKRIQGETFPGDPGVSGENDGSGADPAEDVSGGREGAESGGDSSQRADTSGTGRSTPQEQLAAMTLEEKAAQIFLVTPEALTGYSQVTQAGEATREALETYPVGGLIYFSQNLQSPEQVKAMTAGVQEYARQIQGLPLFLAIDEEGGTVARLGNHPAFGLPKIENMAEIGAKKDGERAYEVGTVIGSYLKEYGFNMDFAPDADVLTEPGNRAIGSRSFGDDPELVAELSGQVAKGLREQGIMPVYKHFPGHGATAGDTHEGFAEADRTLEELKAAELIPFQAAAQSGAECIMAAHISLPQVIGDGTPASLSPVMLTEVLRGDLGFDGLIVTDALNMGAITEHYTAGEAAVKAFQAGADLLLMPEDLPAAYEAILQAVRSGKISEERLDQSVGRILERKAEMEK